MIKLAGALLFLLCAPFIGGTILFLTYPHIFAMFPNSHGILANDLGWWDSVCISFFFHIIFGNQTINNK